MRSRIIVGRVPVFVLLAIAVLAVLTVILTLRAHSVKTSPNVMGAELVNDRVENAGVALPLATAFVGARAIAEQPLEHDARIDLRRQRLRR